MMMSIYVSVPGIKSENIIISEFDKKLLSLKEVISPLFMEKIIIKRNFVNYLRDKRFFRNTSYFGYFYFFHYC